MNKIFLILYLVTFTASVTAQYNGKDFSIFAAGSYTTSAEIFLNPNSSDIVLRNASFDLENIFSPAIDFRYRLSDPLIIGFSVEYMNKVETGDNVTVFVGSRTLDLEVEDGFLLIPFEASLHYLMPFSTEQFKFLMSGGGGYYYGKQSRVFGDAEITSEIDEVAVGIHVGVGMEYLVNEYFGIRLDMKFRNPEFRVKNTYTKTEVNYRGTTIIINQETFDSKVDVNGVTFLLGAAIQF